jgi:putative colanic acid biosynthesis acetyltransferase WcaF
VTVQDLSRFRLPEGFRGRPAALVQLWWLVQASLFRWSPQVFNGWRAWLLRCFGAQIGKRVVIRPTATFTYPWKITLGNHVWIGEGAILYSLGEITIGHDSVVSQGSHLCAGDHDHRQVDFPIRARPIHLGSEVWIGAEVFVAPGVSIGDGSVVGARSAVFKDLPGGMVCLGSPCRPLKPRETIQS